MVQSVRFDFDTSTLPLAQHIPGGSVGHFLAWQCGHVADIEPIRPPSYKLCGL